MFAEPKIYFMKAAIKQGVGSGAFIVKFDNNMSEMEVIDLFEHNGAFHVDVVSYFDDSGAREAFDFVLHAQNQV